MVPRAMVNVSVIVPVFDPGERIDRCIESLLGQSMPAGEYEVVFVDDGSTDGTGERLAALAAEHPHVTTVRIPNSGWPGRPRNVGIDTARGEFVYFVDHDDWIGPEALERLYATAIADEADIVIGKVVGHNKAVPRSLFRENVHDLGLRAAPFNLLTPHKLFRRALLNEHGIRFPEGRRRLEDHMMVVPAYFKARRMAILADYPCYHWVNWTRGRERLLRAARSRRLLRRCARGARHRRRAHRAGRVPRHAVRALVPRQAARPARPQRVRGTAGGAQARECSRRSRR